MRTGEEVDQEGNQTKVSYLTMTESSFSVCLIIVFQLSVGM